MSTRKKSTQEPKGLRYQFIAREKKAYPVKMLCRVLGVSRSGFYDWLRWGQRIGNVRSSYPRLGPGPDRGVGPQRSNGGSHMTARKTLLCSLVLILDCTLTWTVSTGFALDMRNMMIQSQSEMGTVQDVKAFGELLAWLDFRSR